MNNISSGYLPPFLNPRRSDEGESKDEVRASFQGREISDALPASNKIQHSRAALVDFPVDGLDSRAITKRGFDAVTTTITITDSGQTLDLESAWEEIDYALRNLIGLSPAHLAKAKQCMNTLPVSEFRYFEDLTDAVITRLNAAEGTEYPLTGALETGSHPVSGKTGGTLWTLCKYIITALAAESVLTHLSRPIAGARPDHLRHTFQFIGNSNPGFPNRMTLPLPDACSDHHAVDMVTLKPGKTICMKKGSVHGHTSRHFLLNHSRTKKSITLSTGHGSGDLRLFANHTRWPDITRLPLLNSSWLVFCHGLDETHGSPYSSSYRASVFFI
ncbi:hypothetical protein [Endozoicomonas sp. SCSIO W0465]|uniref:hypothetical protein n=1 Tax=Endozoicomonas sp. SCSIO W0465 TaxID=2918516 RepID=UPI00207582E4|nr:hypothetical protein [Endozoicomonas sp. SCSIO W0465]USE35439.1 hypothetical protein MJO57_25610 [Endozoicomonas sp. SCSIO W0465]